MGADINLLERVAESSPVIVLILTAACVVLWRTLREEMREWRMIASRNTEALAGLRETVKENTAATQRLSEAIKVERR